MVPLDYDELREEQRSCVACKTNGLGAALQRQRELSESLRAANHPRRRGFVAWLVEVMGRAHSGRPVG